MSPFAEVVCPTCFEVFAVSAPDVSEVPCELDYDCGCLFGCGVFTVLRLFAFISGSL